MEITKEELAYTAGIVDGEGCIGIHRTGEYERNGSQAYQLIVTVTSTNKDLCIWLQLRFGGNISFWEESKKRNPNHKDRWTWKLHRRKAVDFLQMIEPYLLLKRLQTQNAIRFQSTFMKGRVGRWHDALTEKELAVREACYIMNTSLNAKGNTRS